MNARRKIIWGSFSLLALAAAAGIVLAQSKVGRFTITQRLKEYGPTARARLAPHFEKAGIAYPPSELIFVGLKEEKRLEIYAKSGTNNFKPVRSYPVRAASGVAGPKLKEGDRQVPEGIYQIELLNPNSSYHLSLRVNYPNAFDRAQAAKENRTNLGGDIMIHGKAVSIGCLAMGDEAAEDLFVLAADTGIKKITVILTPVDFRAGKTLPENAQTNAWTPALYAEIKTQLAKYPTPSRP
jgi:murein L,D-transpeptidase YafK